MAHSCAMAGPFTANDRLPAKAERIAQPDAQAPRESVWTDSAALALGALVLALAVWLLLRRRG
ncbi:MAG: hypothetical protein ABJF09_00580 [Qipengyuania citrea]|uniref:hypothetical protein n=2 Tax=Qipengyuania citrea TaxID=225971 RepID=UPI003264E060